MTKIILTSSSKNAAPGQYLGYGLQPVRLCHHLLNAPSGHWVSMEYIDDIAIHSADGNLLLEQSKSALSSNPLADNSVELWKTFANWANLCVEKGIDPTTTAFRLYVCPIKNGSFAQLMHHAKTYEEAQETLIKISKKVTSKNGLKGCNPKISEFLKCGDTICNAIIRNFEIIAETDPLESIKAMLRLSIPEESIDNFCAAAIGTAKNKIEALIRRQSPPILDANAFRTEFRAFIRKHSLLGILASTTGKPSSSDVEKLLSSAPVFVRQLTTIEMPKDYVLRAISDFLQSDADRITWAADGLIVDESFDEFHDSLERHFQITRDEIDDLYETADELTRGKRVYRKCISHQAPLEGHILPGHFIPGSFNFLADAVRIGWHPNYTKLFSNQS